MLLIPTLPVEATLTRPLTVLTCSLYTATFVGSLYLFKATRVGSGAVDDKGNLLTRDHPQVLKARLYGVSVSSIASVAGFCGLLYYSAPSFVKASLKRDLSALICYLSDMCSLAQ